MNEKLNRVAIRMAAGLADRINALENSLEYGFAPQDIDIFWYTNGGFDYQRSKFTDYFQFINYKINVINTDSVKTDEELTKYKNTFRSCGLIVVDKCLKKEPILFRKHIKLNTSCQPITDSSFIGVHLRHKYGSILSCDKSYEKNLLRSFEEIYDSSKNYLLATDSEDVEKYFSNKNNIITIPKTYGNGRIYQAKDYLADTLKEMVNLSNCGVIYRSIGGWACLSAAFSENTPEVKQLSIDNKYLFLGGIRR